MKLTHAQQILLTNYAYEMLEKGNSDKATICLNLVLIDAGERKPYKYYYNDLQACLETAQQYFILKPATHATPI